MKVCFEAIDRLVHPRRPTDLLAVAAAALVGFAGNEIVAAYRIRAGRAIGSAALVADGLHARADGITSLAVLLGAGGAAIGWYWADPVVGLAITVAILGILRQVARDIYRRLMDAVDPAMIDQAEQVLLAAPGVLGVGHVRLRWTGHRMRADCEVLVDGGASAIQAHQVAVDAEHALLHAMPALIAAVVHADPVRPGGPDLHADLASHRRAGPARVADPRGRGTDWRPPDRPGCYIWAVTITDLQRRLREFVAERDWQQFQTPKNLVMALTGEVGELNEIFQWLTPEQAAAVMSEPAQATNVADEIADVLAYLLRLADVLEVDVAAALAAKMEKNAIKYPVEAARGIAARYTDLGGPASGGPGPGR